MSNLISSIAAICRLAARESTRELMTPKIAFESTLCHSIRTEIKSPIEVDVDFEMRMKSMVEAGDKTDDDAWLLGTDASPATRRLSTR